MKVFTQNLRFRLLVAVIGHCLLWANGLKAQITFSTDVAPIIYNNCSSCHNPNGLKNDLPFTNYAEVKRSASAIAGAVGSKHMPPWPPNPSYKHFLGERNLSAAQIQTITDWLAQGTQRGDSTLEPALPVFTQTPLGTPDLVLSMSQKFTHSGNGRDAFRVFVIPSHLLQNKQVLAVEFVPGNLKIVHHATLGLDTTGTAKRLDVASPGYGYAGNGIDFGFTPAADNFGQYVPGTPTNRYPPKIGKTLYKNSDIIVQIHYAPSGTVETDSSFIRIYYASVPVTRPIETDVITHLNLVLGQTFTIAPNAVSTFHGVYHVNSDISLLEVQPHCNYLGKTWKVYAITPNLDTINLIKIDDWDFHWQGSFMFDKFQKIPAGSTIHAFGSYDNTNNNPKNPHTPPVWVTFGSSTLDEMFVIYFSYLPYQINDENTSLLTGLPVPTVTKVIGEINSDHELEIYPNPAKGTIHLNFNSSTASETSLEITDLQGRTVFQNRMQSVSGENKFIADVSSLASGLYFVRVNDFNIIRLQKIAFSQ